MAGSHDTALPAPLFLQLVGEIADDLRTALGNLAKTVEPLLLGSQRPCENGAQPFLHAAGRVAACRRDLFGVVVDLQLAFQPDPDIGAQLGLEADLANLVRDAHLGTATYLAEHQPRLAGIAVVALLEHEGRPQLGTDAGFQLAFGAQALRKAGLGGGRRGGRGIGNGLPTSRGRMPVIDIAGQFGLGGGLGFRLCLALQGQAGGAKLRGRAGRGAGGRSQLRLSLDVTLGDPAFQLGRDIAVDLGGDGGFRLQAVGADAGGRLGGHLHRARRHALERRWAAEAECLGLGRVGKVDPVALMELVADRRAGLELVLVLRLVSRHCRGRLCPWPRSRGVCFLAVCRDGCRLAARPVAVVLGLGQIRSPGWRPPSPGPQGNADRRYMPRPEIPFMSDSLQSKQLVLKVRSGAKAGWSRGRHSRTPPGTQPWASRHSRYGLYPGRGLISRC
ncbi:hypothetical protein AZA_29486 [Nitrospirillum viridazoti Y2]|nr:hypothetical protein AZA_29486 [Nitrospirillum amazonense Y2]